MTIAEWLDRRTPAPPQVLRARVEAALCDSLASDASHMPDACLGAAERLIEMLLRADCTTRESALDLLTADALVTYAFEAAGGAPTELAARAANAMTRIARLGTLRREGATA